MPWGCAGAAPLMPAELSGGMARRVGLARAIALDPALMMYDEPFAGLDPISCNVVGNLIRRLNDTLGLTSIVVSYDAQETLKVIDYVYFLADGAIVAQGTTEEVKSSNDPFVSQFIRALPDGPGAVPLCSRALRKGPRAREALARAAFAAEARESCSKHEQPERSAFEERPAASSERTDVTQVTDSALAAWREAARPEPKASDAHLQRTRRMRAPSRESFSSMRS